MKRIYYLLFSLPILLFTCCISTNKLIKLPTTDINNFSFENISGNYLNSSTDSTFKTLWKILSECNSLKDDTTKLSKDTYINLTFNDCETMTVKAINDTILLNSFELKGKQIEKYFSINRRLILIPLPFIYFRYRERKVLLAISKDGNLIAKCGLEEFLWIFIMSGGYGGESQVEYNKF